MSHDHHHQGLAHDLQLLLQRRRTLGLLAGAGALLASCGGGGGSSATSVTRSGSSGSTSSTSSTSSSSCTLIPSETEGPYPGDGSNTVNGNVANALTLSGIVRSDIRASLPPASGVAIGVPLTLTLKLVDSSNSCASLAGYAIYVWHCNSLGGYSMYASGITTENYLRGVQLTGSDGTVTFQTIFPGCYAGRVPHIHFEIYRDTAEADSYVNKLRTSQLAIPFDICNAVYADTSTYGSSASNLATESFASDNVFSDGVSTQLATVTGSVAAGYAASLVVGL